jgi:hypothetical protein
MSNAFDRGYSDYTKDRKCLVYRTVRGVLKWDSDYGNLLDEPEVWGADYIAGYTQACKDDDGNVPMASKERLRR